MCVKVQGCLMHGELTLSQLRQGDFQIECDIDWFWVEWHTTTVYTCRKMHQFLVQGPVSVGDKENAYFVNFFPYTFPHYKALSIHMRYHFYLHVIAGPRNHQTNGTASVYCLPCELCRILPDNFNIIINYTNTGRKVEIQVLN